jgi:hypothetical protein
VQLALTEEQDALKCERRAYFAGLVGEVDGLDSEEPAYKHFIRRMGEDR